MNRLSHIIGPAPSELDPAALLMRIGKEQDRVLTGFRLSQEAFAEKTHIVKAKAPRARSAKARAKDEAKAKAIELLKSMGLNDAQIAQLQREKV